MSDNIISKMEDDIRTHLVRMTNNFDEWPLAKQIETLEEAISEIKKLRAALHFAIGELSTFGEYQNTHPEQLVQEFLTKEMK